MKNSDITNLSIICNFIYDWTNLNVLNQVVNNKQINYQSKVHKVIEGLDCHLQINLFISYVTSGNQRWSD